MAIVVVPAAAGDPAGSTPADLVRLTRAAYLARYKGDSRTHAASDLNALLTWCRQRDVDVMTATRGHLEL